MIKSLNTYLWGPTPEQRVRAWQAKLRAEQRHLDREIGKLKLETDKVRTQLKQLAKKGDVKSARILAREVLRSNKQMDRLTVSKARLGSIGIQLQNQLSMLKVTGSLQKSTEIMKLSNSVINLPQISASMREMSMEMTKAGIMEEMLEDTLEGLDDDEELEEEADEEVDKVLLEVTGQKLGKVGSVGTTLPATESAEDEAQHEADMERMRQQLEGMLNG